MGWWPFGSGDKQQQAAGGGGGGGGGGGAVPAGGGGGGDAAAAAAPKKLKICCACPDTKRLRDECIALRGEEHPYCAALIEAHLACLRMEGFNV